MLKWLLIVYFAFVQTCLSFEFGISKEEIVFSQSAPLSGNSANFGESMQSGILAAFNAENMKGGVGGRKLILKSFDDQYDPYKSIDNFNNLLNNSFAMIGSIGTPNVRPLVPLITQNKIPLIAPFSGAKVLKDYNPYIITLRESNADEVKRFIEHSAKNLNFKTVVFVHQDDAYASGLAEEVRKIISDNKLNLLAEFSFPRNTLSVKTFAKKTKDLNPDLVITTASYMPVAEYIKTLRELGSNTAVYTLAITSLENLRSLIPDNYFKNIYITQVSPDPNDESLVVAKEFRRDMKIMSKENDINYLSFFGYLSARLTIKILHDIQETKEEITRERFVSKLFSYNKLDIGGYNVSFAPNSNLGYSKIFITKIDDEGKFNIINDDTN